MTILGGFLVAVLVVEPASLIPSCRPRAAFWGLLYPFHDSVIPSANT